MINTVKRNYIFISSSLLLLVAIYFTSRYSYLLFHSITEVFSITISFAIFMFAWNSRRFHDNDFFLFLGIVYLFVGAMDFFHTLSYQGMNIFTDYDYYANQLWIGTRYLESISLLAAFCFLKSKKESMPFIVFPVYSIVFILIMLSIFHWRTFPECFIAGKGLTAFKVISEYIICLILAVGIFMLYRNRKNFDDKVFRFMLYSFVFTIIAELAFTFYISNYGISNLVGHYFKIFSFYMIYKAIIETGLVTPFDLLFKDLQNKTEKLERHAQELKELNANKDKFFSIISHDLRTPFTALLGLSELLSKKVEMYPKEKIKEFSYHIFISAKNLYALLENLLEWSRIQTGNMHYAPDNFLLDNLITTNIKLLSSNAEKKRVHLLDSTQKKISVHADMNMVNSVIQNLIGNAIKFTGSGGSVTVNTSLSNKHVEVSVVDTGVGMDKEKLSKLFRIDTNISSKGTEGEPGTGLGLILSKELIEKNNGTISADSVPGKGSVFRFTLPLAD